MNDTIIEKVLTYLMGLVNKHTKLSGFYLGQRSDLNNNNYDTPFVFIELPLNLNSVDMNNVRAKKIELGIRISCWSKSYEDDNGNEYIITDETEDYQGNVIENKNSVLNEIHKIVPIQMGETHRYLSHIVGKLIKDWQSGIIDFEYVSSTYQTRMAAFNDRFVGTECLLTLAIPNLYLCELDAYFEV